MSLSTVPTGKKGDKPLGRDALEHPYRAEHEDSQRRVMTAASHMPKSVEAGLVWFAEALSLELPETLHRPGVWADRHRRFTVVARSREFPDGIVDHGPGVGGSLTGSPDETGEFRAYLYGSPNAVDEEGFYLRPLHRALSEMVRTGMPVTARILFALAQGGFQWHAMGARLGYLPEVWEMYLGEAVRQLWRLTIRQDERRAVS